MLCKYGIWFKNDLSTFIRATHTTLGEHIGKTVDVYDIVVNTHYSCLFLADLAVVFKSLKRTRMMLNLEKYFFVSPEKFLRFLASHWGIKANPKKIHTIEQMSPLVRVQQVQHLTGCVW